MRALKVLYRSPNTPTERHPPHARRSAIPSVHSLQYWQGKITKPEIGRLMVYLEMDEAKQFCYIAGKWYRNSQMFSPTDRGDMEIWRVECHNLYKIFHIIQVQGLGCEEEGNPKGYSLREFWRMVLAGQDPRIPEVRYAVEARVPVWTTDYLIPSTRLAVFDIRSWRFVEGAS